MNMRKKVLLAITLMNLIHYNFSDDFIQHRNNNNHTEKVLSRRKRYLIFPEGSSFSVATCMTVGVYGNPQFSIISWGLNWGFSYNLPSNSSYFKTENGDRDKRSFETKPMAQRRHRRSLFNRLEVIMQEMGYNGRDCILRALCESPKVFGKSGSNLVAELIRIIFTFPKSKVLPFEHEDLMVYDKAHRSGKAGKTECQTAYPKCGFSLIQLALGKYSSPQINY
ncbi:CLUMA_CG018269, isoform A, partial [Clunio marinus]